MTASATPCPTTGVAAGTCEIRFDVRPQTSSVATAPIFFTSGSLAQLGPVRTTRPTGTTGATGTTGTTGTTSVGGSTGEAGSPTTTVASASTPPREQVTFNFTKIRWTYDLAQQLHVRELIVTVTTSLKRKLTLTDPVVGIQDSKNIADGAAKSQAVE